MTTQKKTTKKRSKSYRSMSVPELVKARQQLVEKMQQIDKILNQAVVAVGAVKQTASNTEYGYSKSLRTSPSLNAQVASRPSNAMMTTSVSQGMQDNQSTAFSIFDAESFNAGIENGTINSNGFQQEYLVDNPGQPVKSQTPKGVEVIKPLLPSVEGEGEGEEEEYVSEEMNSLMNEVSEGLKHVKSTQTANDEK